MSTISKISETRQDAPRAISGQGMDRVVARKAPLGRKLAYAAGAVLAAGVAWLLLGLITGGRSLSINAQRIMVSEVTLGTFEDFIPLRGRLVPSSTVYLDAIEGGRVEQVFVEDGTVVAAGDPIAVLSNTNLQLEVLSREAAVTEQLNNMRTIELQLEQNRLSHKRNLVEIDYQITRLGRSIERQEDLASKNLVSQSTLDELRDELTYYRNRREVTLESQATDARMQEQQLHQLRAANDQLEAGLAFARKNLDDLRVRAPVSGKLSGFDIEIGQSISRGERLGQVDDPEGFKLNVKIDEFYLGRVDLEQKARVEHNGRPLDLRVTKIYPQVNTGQFEVDMAFEDNPAGLRRGQTLQVELTLGDNSDAVLIPNGSFYQETGGSWIFVVTPDGSEAVKRTVRLGRRNTDYIEVLDGLEPGEKVVTSPYTSYVGMDRLVLGAD
ncbi:MAG: efflux RND transporter periplasmic adaptor subunit [Gammaproteobacteria bacterium]|nr:efflux RND transporter periplasmic adaptor subunit [Gammaproteobacteria bacterium]MDH4256001.1 efflux RND transporter periplasmic adaptor subunit [Gammaproteobacteria bacterium]MDH5310256.1 efflux RND transporter periplasmic adaptor subunit [Gammaproteobacteria bacterium]